MGLVLTDQFLLLYPPELARSFQLPRFVASTNLAVQVPVTLPIIAKMGPSLQVHFP